MGNYNNFSHFYDIFTYDVDYKKRADYIMEIFEKWDKKPTLLLDFACGTGNFSALFAEKGIDVIGVDSSEGMLAVAMDKNAKLKNKVLYLNQTGSDLDLFGTVDGAVCCLDSLNHICNKEELEETLSKVSLFLEQDRLFVFDMNTLYKHQKVLKGSSYRVKKKGIECFWKNTLLSDGVTVEVELNFTYKTGFFRKEMVTEIIREKAYTSEEIAEMLENAGLKLEAVYGENTFESPKENSQRNIYIARKV